MCDGCGSARASGCDTGKLAAQAEPGVRALRVARAAREPAAKRLRAIARHERSHAAHGSRERTRLHAQRRLGGHSLAQHVTGCKVTQAVLLLHASGRAGRQRQRCEGANTRPHRPRRPRSRAARLDLRRLRPLAAARRACVGRATPVSDSTARCSQATGARDVLRAVQPRARARHAPTRMTRFSGRDRQSSRRCISRSIASLGTSAKSMAAAGRGAGEERATRCTGCPADGALALLDDGGDGDGRCALCSRVQLPTRARSQPI